MLRRIRISLLLVAGLALMAGTALAATNPSGTGQPSQSCGSATAPSTPGKAVTAPGSAFNPTGVAPSVYAGQQPQNSQNPKSVAQYDAACFQVSQSH